MTANINNSEERNHGDSLTHIPQHQIISYLRHYFEINNPNIAQIERYYHYNHHYNRGVLNQDDNSNDDDEDEDKDDNDESGIPHQEGSIQYHHLERQYTGEEEDDEADENNQSNESNGMDTSAQDYIDFRVYPLHIDWYEIENGGSHYFDILSHYGNFGVATLTGIANLSNIELLAGDLVYSFLSYYYDLVTQSNNDDSIITFIKHLPSLRDIDIILNQRMLIKKEIVCIKVVIDIYDHYLRSYNKVLNRFIIKDLFMPIIGLFFSILSEEEIAHLHNEITSHMKKTHNILSKLYVLFNMHDIIDKLGCKVFKQKHHYIKHYNEIRINTIQLLGGANQEEFLL